MRKVIKRDGTEVPFEKEKITKAIMGAMIDVSYTNNDYVPDKKVAQRIANDISKIEQNECTVEEIQDLVETKLMDSKHKEVAKAYINYRLIHSMARSQSKELWDAISEKLTASNVQNQNANVDEHSFGGRTGEATAVVTKKYALDYLVSPLTKYNHENNRIYIHDLDNYAIGAHNCLSVPFDDLLKNGFNTRQTDVRPAGSVNTAFQLVAVVFQIQSLQQFGGVSSTHLDWTMVPYVRLSFYKHYNDGLEFIEGKDRIDLTKEQRKSISINDDLYTQNSRAYEYALRMTEQEVHQAAEGLFHNLRY